MELCKGAGSLHHLSFSTFDRHANLREHFHGWKEARQFHCTYVRGCYLNVLDDDPLLSQLPVGSYVLYATVWRRMGIMRERVCLGGANINGHYDPHVGVETLSGNPDDVFDRWY